MGGRVAARLVQSEPASAPGRLHAIRAGASWFPALVPGKGPARVHGTLCEMRLTAGELARLDRYEGREYRRVGLVVRTASGRGLSAQAYLWRIALPAKASLIERGNFLDWLRETRGKAFST